MVAERVLPHDSEAEQALLGCVLHNQSVIDEVIERLKPAHFYTPRNKKIYTKMLDMYRHGEAIDAVTVKSRLETDGIIEECGGSLYILDLMEKSPTLANASRYADIVVSNALSRKLVSIGVDIAALGYDGEKNHSIDDAIGEAVSLVTGIALDQSTTMKTSEDVAFEFLDSLKNGKQKYISPRGVDFVKAKGGDLIVIAGGTSVGKTAITLDWANDWSKRYRVAYFEYEMEEKELMSRLICREAGVTMSQIQDRNLTVEEVHRIEDAAEDLMKRELFIEEVWCDIGTLTSKIRKCVQNNRAEIVMIDHLGLIGMPSIGQMNHAKAVGNYITNPLKRLASELGVTIVLLVQLNREGQRDGTFPKLHHLRDSGEIEQDASIVLTLWSERLIRDEWSKRISIREKSGIVYPEELNDDSFYLFRVGVEKHRNGRLGEAYALYHGDNFRFDFRLDEPETIIQGKMM